MRDDELVLLQGQYDNRWNMHRSTSVRMLYVPNGNQKKEHLLEQTFRHVMFDTVAECFTPPHQIFTYDLHACIASVVYERSLATTVMIYNDDGLYKTLDVERLGGLQNAVFVQQKLYSRECTLDSIFSMLAI